MLQNIRESIARVYVVLVAMTGGGLDIPPPSSATIVHAADTVLVRQTALRFHVVKDRRGRAGRALSPIGVALLRGRRSIVILDGVDRVIAKT